MSSNSNDKVRAPIEIETSDIEKLNELIQDVKEAQSAARELEPMRGRKALTDDRSAVRTEAFETRGGIFGGETGKEEKFRDKKSKSAFQRESEFGKMKDQVENMQATQYDLIGGLVNLGFLGGIGGIGGGGKGQMIQSGMAKASTGVKGGGMAMLGMGGGLMGGVRGLMLKGGIYGMIAMVALEIVTSTLQQFLAPGGALDRRFKRDIQFEEVKFTDLRQKEEISQGRRIIRVTTSVGLRGVTDQVRSNLDLYSSGKRIFDLDGTLMSKNTGWGNP
tara:strand:- start:1770 stop:2597 length:828 start_codon:yes stop_codon:yes gene_type:complete